MTKKLGKKCLKTILKHACDKSKVLAISNLMNQFIFVSKKTENLNLILLFFSLSLSLLNSPAAIAKMIDESFYLIFAYVQDTYSNSERSPDELPTRVYSISLYCSDNNNGMKKSRISSNMTENYGLIARITPSFSLN